MRFIATVAMAAVLLQVPESGADQDLGFRPMIQTNIDAVSSMNSSSWSVNPEN